jgi:sulfate transport system permease protein
VARTDMVVGRRPSSRIAQRVIVLVYVAVLVLVPLVIVTWRTFEPGLQAFWSAISSDQAVKAFILTAETALVAVALNMVFGVGMALLLTRYRFPGKRMLNALCDLPMAISPIVVGIALVLVRPGERLVRERPG